MVAMEMSCHMDNDKGLVKKYRGGGRSRRGVGHHVFSPSDGVGHAILSLG